MDFKMGDQIAYHLGKPDQDFGFVIGANAGRVFCRFWSRKDSVRLRTTANSEPCDPTDLVLYQTHTEAEVNAKLFLYGYVQIEANSCPLRRKNAEKSEGD